VEAELFHAVERKDRRDNVTVTFRNVAKCLKWFVRKAKLYAWFRATERRW